MSKKRKPWWMPFNVEKFLADTTSLTPSEGWAYINLGCRSDRSGRDIVRPLRTRRFRSCALGGLHPCEAQHLAIRHVSVPPNCEPFAGPTAGGSILSSIKSCDQPRQPQEQARRRASFITPPRACLSGGCAPTPASQQVANTDISECRSAAESRAWDRAPSAIAPYRFDHRSGSHRT
jgi:hypothetical protein